MSTGVSVLTDKETKYNEDSATAVGKHCHHHNHAPNIENIQVIGHANSKRDLLLKEAFLMGVVKPTIINVQKFSLPLELFSK